MTRKQRCNGWSEKDGGVATLLWLLAIPIAIVIVPLQWIWQLLFPPKGGK